MRVLSVSMANCNSKKRVDNTNNQPRKIQSGTPNFGSNSEFKYLAAIVAFFLVMAGNVALKVREYKIKHSDAYLIELGKQEAREELLKNKGRQFIIDSIKNTLQDSAENAKNAVLDSLKNDSTAKAQKAAKFITTK